VIVRQVAGQIYAVFGMPERAKTEYLEGYRLDPTNSFWEPH